MIRSKAFIILFIFTLVYTISYAQVDEYKMRQESTSHQLKNQELGTITQRATTLSKDGNSDISSNSILDLLRANSDFYVADHGNYSHNAYFRNRLISPALSLNNVEFSSVIYSNNLQILEFMDLRIYDKTELLYGRTIAKPNIQNGHIALFHPTLQDSRTNLDSSTISRMDDDSKLGVNLHTRYNTNSLSSLIAKTFRLRRGFHSISLYGNYTNRYPIGTYLAKKNWGYLPLVANTYNGAGTGFWIQNSDSSQYRFQNLFLGLENLLHLKLKERNELNMFIHLGGAVFQNQGRLLQNNNQYLFSDSRTNSAPMIMAYVQHTKRSEEAKLYTQINYAMTYQHFENNTADRYDINDEQYNNHYEENKISFQLNAFKNLNPRNVYYYGTSSSANFIKNNFHIEDNFNNFFDKQPILNSNAYFRHEIRPNSDISWFYGGNLGIESFAMKTEPYSKGYNNVISPYGQLNFSWTRHTCESSNYSVNFFFNLNKRSIQDIKPTYGDVFFKPNYTLKSEKELLLEVNVYRKIEDRLEVHVSPYFRTTWDAIRTQDHLNNSNEIIQFQSRTYYMIQSENLPILNESGLQTELKYHLLKSLLIYSTLNYNKTFTPIPDNIVSQNLPLYGAIGFKYRGPILSAQLWSNYNLGEQISASTLSRYVKHYGFNESSKYSFSNSFTLNAFIKTQLNKKIDFGMRLENIMDLNYFNYLSTIHGLGRNFTLQMNFNL